MRSDFDFLVGKSRPIQLRTIQVPARFRVLFLAPHPDDFDAVGITMRRLHQNGNPIKLVVMTSGESGVDDSFAAACAVKNKAEIREMEQRASCHYFGLPAEALLFLSLEKDTTGKLKSSPENLALLTKAWSQHSPDIVCLPHGNDANANHQMTYWFYRRIVKAYPRNVLALLTRDPKTIGMRSDAYMDFGTEEAEWKGELLRHHRSQQARNLRTSGHGFDERILRVNRQAAKDIGHGMRYAEVFELETHTGYSKSNI